MFQLSGAPFRALYSAALSLNVLFHAPAYGEQEQPAIFGINCSLETAFGETAEAVVKVGEGNIIRLKINELRLHNVVALAGHSHSPSIAFSSNMDSRGVYTLVIHRDFFRPHPEGYDPSKPPATLTIQNADEDVVPYVEIFLGSCRFN